MEFSPVGFGSRFENLREAAANAVGALASQSSIRPVKRAGVFAAEVLTTSPQLADRLQADAERRRQERAELDSRLEEIMTPDSPRRGTVSQISNYLN